MFNFIKRIFKGKEKNKMQQMKCFDVITQAEGCKPSLQTGLQASSIQELAGLLSMTGEKIIEVKREYAGDVVKSSLTNPEYLNKPDSIPQSALHTIQKKIDPREQARLEMEKMQKTESGTQVQKPLFPNPPGNESRIQIQQQVKSKPKFYTIGDVEIKEQDGKIYQKQWIKVSSSDSTNYRIISDKTNKIVPLTGKHVEMKKWVLVDNSEEQEDQKQLELLNG